jgi:hypothetical protein
LSATNDHFEQTFWSATVFFSSLLGCYRHRCVKIDLIRRAGANDFRPLHGGGGPESRYVDESDASASPDREPGHTSLHEHRPGLYLLRHEAAEDAGGMHYALTYHVVRRLGTNILALDARATRHGAFVSVYLGLPPELAWRPPGKASSGASTESGPERSPFRPGRGSAASSVEWTGRLSCAAAHPPTRA